MEPTPAQLRSLYAQSYALTNLMFLPIQIVRLDERTGNLFILAGQDLELEIAPDGLLEIDT